MEGYHNILLQSSSPGRKRERNSYLAAVSGVFQSLRLDLIAQP